LYCVFARIACLNAYSHFNFAIINCYFEKEINEMFIAHASLPADEPERIARVLAEIMNGEALPFPPGGPGMWMAWSGDAQIELEIAPRGAALEQGANGAGWRKSVLLERRSSECHIAIGVDRPATEILAIASTAGWPAARHSRGDFFRVVEVWIEGVFLIEFLDPAETAAYKCSVTPANWKKVFGFQQ